MEGKTRCFETEEKGVLEEGGDGLKIPAEVSSPSKVLCAMAARLVLTHENKCFASQLST